MHFEIYVFCLSEMGSLSQCTGYMTRSTEAAFWGANVYLGFQVEKGECDNYTFFDSSWATDIGQP